MKVTVLSLCLLLSAVCAVFSDQFETPLFCPLRMRYRIRVLQCTVKNLRPRDQQRVIKVMSYNGLDYRRLAQWICSPNAAFALLRVFNSGQIKRFLGTGINCLLYLLRDLYEAGGMTVTYD